MSRNSVLLAHEHVFHASCNISTALAGPCDPFPLGPTGGSYPHPRVHLQPLGSWFMQNYSNRHETDVIESGSGIYVLEFSHDFGSSDS
jgi:hypothetical protein